MSKNDLPEELRSIVKVSVACLGRVIEKELGHKAYLRIETIRKRMADTRTASSAKTTSELKKTFLELKRLSGKDRFSFAVAYTLMLETMNACENAYRTFRLQERANVPHPMSTVPVTYVLTAHPTESRSSNNISIFYEIQKLLTNALAAGLPIEEKALTALLEIAWRVPIVRSRKPTVEDEAEHIYSVVLRPENLEKILKLSRTEVLVYLRSWVGGDKDGHPGVTEASTQNSLQASREMLVRYARKLVYDVGQLLDLFPSAKLAKLRTGLKESLAELRELTPGDGLRVKKLHQRVLGFKKEYEKSVGPVPEAILQLEQMLHTFPALVIPLELREDSSIITEANINTNPKKSFAIERMIKRIGVLSKGGNPRWYAQGFIISMCQSIEHIEAASNLLVRNLGGLKIRVIPLFEQQEALHQSTEIIEALLKRARFQNALKKDWLGRVEIMLGYSDSSKEAGVFPSRLEVSTAMRKLDEVCKKHKVQPIFFHGSGGSVDRGGGPVEDQLASWSKGALSFYKATIQGEMVERSFASPEIAESQILKISQTAIKLSSHVVAKTHSAALQDFADGIEATYREAIGSQTFMGMVEDATPYRFLSALKIGSRPTKRASSQKGTLAVSSLRAIPWILCWTQTRVLFPTWWGVGRSWQKLAPAHQKKLKQEYKTNALFRSFIHVLGFTLAKVELPMWNFYLSESTLPKSEALRFQKQFAEEFAATLNFFHGLTGKKDPLWFRPWLRESVLLRSPMIHPLNLLQILAEKSHDLPLLRVAVTGVASGMLTTG
jgi:phosphoenolpyruvate carboxylase